MPKKEKKKKPYAYDVLLVNPIALKGSMLIADEKKEEVESILGRNYKELLSKLEYDYSLSPEILETFIRYNKLKVYSLGNGGINQGLWNIHKEENIGILVNIADIFILRASIELSDYYNINPYELNSEGAFLILVNDSRKLIYELQEKGIFSKVIGKTVKEKKVIILGKGVRRTLKPPKSDSIVTLD